MQRYGYKLFFPARIANLALPNRLVRSATWDPSIIHSRRMTDEVLTLYRELATGGVGLIITGGFPVIEGDMLGGGGSVERACSYDDIHIEGIDRLASVVHRSGTGCKVVDQLEAGYLDAAPSDIPSPCARPRDCLRAWPASAPPAALRCTSVPRRQSQSPRSARRRRCCRDDPQSRVRRSTSDARRRRRSRSRCRSSPFDRPASDRPGAASPVRRRHPAC